VKLSDIMKNHGWSNYELGKPSNKLKVYQKEGFFLGVQKIGNLFRLDIQQVFDLGGFILPGDKVVDNTIIPRDQLEATLNEILPQL